MPNQVKQRPNFCYNLEVNQFLSYTWRLRAHFDLFTLTLIFWRFWPLNLLYWKRQSIIAPQQHVERVDEEIDSFSPIILFSFHN